MTSLYEGRITDLLSNSMRYNPETIAMGYAILQEKRRLMELADRTRLMAFVDALTEPVLDYLAVELRTPAYRDSFPLEVKRRLVAGTLPFYAKLGTPAAVNWAIGAIFGGGGIEEWYGYGGDPHHFRAVIPTAGPLTPESLDEFRRILVQVKRLSSWLDSMITVTELGGEVYAAPALGPSFSSTQPPRREPPLAPAAALLVPGLWGSRTSLGLPAREPEFHGARVWSLAPALGGSLCVTRLPEISGEREESI